MIKILFITLYDDERRKITSGTGMSAMEPALEKGIGRIIRECGGACQ